MAFAVRLDKENFKFSGTHFTIFSADAGERLHGHNYQVAVRLEIESVDASLGMAFDFNTIKPLIKELCAELDEYVLIPEKSPYLELKSSQQQLEVKFAKKKYSFPESDVRKLPLVNITSEELARYLAQRLAARLKGEIS